MPIRKMRRRKMRRSVIRRKRRTSGGSRKTEVKYISISTIDVPIKITASAAPTSTLYAQNRYAHNILSFIEQGTAADQRIGDRIFLKHITIVATTRGCPALSTYSVGTYYLRCLLHNTGGTRPSITTDIQNFFRTVDKNNFNGIVDQTKFKLFQDKLVSVKANEGPNWTSLDYTHNGPYRRFIMKHTFNKEVIYERGTNEVKNDDCSFDFSILLGVPGAVNANNLRQIACIDMHINVYYTDL